jgi:hypothetical protein
MNQSEEAIRLSTNAGHRVPLQVAAALLALLTSATAGIQTVQADSLVVILDDRTPGTYLVTVAAGGQASVISVKSIRPGSPPPTFPDGDPTAFEKEITWLTTAAIKGGGTKTTGAGLSAVYSLVSDEVASGRIASDKWVNAIKAASDAVLNIQPDASQWAGFRDGVGKALTSLQAQGKLASKAQIAGALKEIARGMNTATGFQGSPSQLVRLEAAERERRPDAFLEGIDLPKIVELIKLVIELLKLFGGTG